MNFRDEITELLPKIDAGGSVDERLYEALITVRSAALKGGRLFFIGNGGSAAIASHMAIDWTKNAGIVAHCFNDLAALTAIGNDLGFDQIFAYAIQRYGEAGDVLFAISSSGRSPNILAGAGMAKLRGLSIVTFSGFSADNPLRKMGSVNFYVPSSDYGLVECSHLILNHDILNAAIGLRIN